MLGFCLTGDIDAPVSCHNPVAGVFSMFGRAEYKKLYDPNSVNAAKHQWAVGACLELQSHAKLANGKNGGSYLSNSSSTNDLRHYKYIICTAHVEIWEMRVVSSDDSSAFYDCKADTWSGSV